MLSYHCLPPLLLITLARGTVDLLMLLALAVPRYRLTLAMAAHAVAPMPQMPQMSSLRAAHIRTQKEIINSAHVVGSVDITPKPTVGRFIRPAERVTDATMGICAFTRSSASRHEGRRRRFEAALQKSFALFWTFPIIHRYYIT